MSAGFAMENRATSGNVAFNTQDSHPGPPTAIASSEPCWMQQNTSKMSVYLANQNDEVESHCTSKSAHTSSMTRSTPLTSVEVPTYSGLEKSSDEACESAEHDDGYLALGSIRLERRDDGGVGSALLMHSPFASEPYPPVWMISAERKGWIRTQAVPKKHDAESAVLRIRVFVLPEDVARGSRGSLRDFRKVVKQLLNFLDRSVAVWSGDDDDDSSATSFRAYDVPRTTEEESLFYIFNTLQSPCPNLSSINTSVYGYQAVSDVMSDSIAGLKTELYPYQRRSVAAMVQREAEPAKILDQRKRIYKDIYDRPFYLDVHDGALLKNSTLYTEPQGGILAETMGYGKTLICIALILATRGHYPKVPEDRIDSVPSEPRKQVGSLLAMAARRAQHEGVPWKTEFRRLGQAGYHFDRCVTELKKYNRAYAEPIFTPTTPSRAGKRESANIVRLCSATLIVLPPNLLIQWQLEIQKHTVKDALDVLTIDVPTKEVPPWQELLHYDVVLITKPRFEQEYRDDDLNQGKSRRGDARYKSPLTDVRWLRVICDEGHGFAGSSSRTNAMAMLDKMYIERRWVVSGTPSSTLHGVEVGLATTDSVSKSTSTSLDRQTSLNVALQKRRTPNARDLEAKDLERLRLIIVNFLRLQPWANQRGSSDVANWKRYLGPVADANGHNYTSPALRDVLQTLIIRHRIEDIDTDLMLPPLHNKVVYLEPSYYDKLAINVFFLLLASNYVTSEREDEDYMFHPRNRKKLDLVINNLRQATFHWVGLSEHDVRETLRVSNEYLDKHIDKISDADGRLLTEAIVNGERALADPSWRAFATLHEIGVYIKHFPEHARESWALDGRDVNPVLVGTVQAREVQKYVKNQVDKGSADVFLGLGGAGVKVMNSARHRAEEEQKSQQTARSKVPGGEKQQVGVAEEPKLKSTSTSSATSPRSSRSTASASVPQKRRRSSSGNSSSSSMAANSTPDSLSAARAAQPLPDGLSKSRITAFTSSKLTYLATRLMNLPPATKSLVFYQHTNTAFFIAEALELLSIPFRIYASTLSVAQRNEYLAEFNSDASDIRVMLMDIKQASHGLHIACASYVCIVAPIWEAGVESQAIKRAHRIGQIKEVHVETLVLQGTFEEEMVRRRRWKDENLDTQDTVDAGGGAADTPSDVSPSSQSEDGRRIKSRNAHAGKSLLDDRHMVSVLKDIKFMKFNQEEENVGGRVGEMMGAPVDKRMLFGSIVAGISSDGGTQVDRPSTEHMQVDTSGTLPRRGIDGHFRVGKKVVFREEQQHGLKERLDNLAMDGRSYSTEAGEVVSRKKLRVGFANV